MDIGLAMMELVLLAIQFAIQLAIQLQYNTI